MTFEDKTEYLLFQTYKLGREPQLLTIWHHPNCSAILPAHIFIHTPNVSLCLPQFSGNSEAGRSQKLCRNSVDHVWETHLHEKWCILVAGYSNHICAHMKSKKTKFRLISSLETYGVWEEWGWVGRETINLNSTPFELCSHTTVEKITSLQSSEDRANKSLLLSAYAIFSPI